MNGPAISQVHLYILHILDLVQTPDLMDPVGPKHRSVARLLLNTILYGIDNIIMHS